MQKYANLINLSCLQMLLEFGDLDLSSDENLYRYVYLNRNSDKFEM